MEKLTNLQTGNYTIKNLVDVDQSVSVSGDATLYIKNTNSSDITNSIDFKLEANSSLDMILFDVNSSMTVDNKFEFKLQQNAALKLSVISLNSGATKSRVVCDLNEAGANANINVISVADQNVKTNFDVVANNNCRDTKANIRQRAVALNGGENIFTATGFIDKDCSKAINFQESRVLLLDDAAKGDASPILLINHHDVEAGHAAGVSRVNDEEMYYLMSRGIDRKTAEELMTVAFIRPIIDNISDEDVREEVFTMLKNKASYEKN